MRILPETVLEQIQFCETHAPIWSASPSAVGLTSAMCSALAAATASTRKSYNDAHAARQASVAATTKLGTDAAIMRSQVADLIRQIKAFAELQAVPGNVYTAAQIPRAAIPTPAAAPGKPTDFRMTLNADGSVTLSWIAADSAASTGAFFMVSRKLPGQSAFVGVGGGPGATGRTRRASFTDTTLPAAAAGQGAQYIVQGFRGARAGESSDAVTVQFGVDGAGAVSSVRLAA